MASVGNVRTLAYRFFVIAALVAWCLALLAVRIHRASSLFFAFLVWNLFLAAVPAVAALVARYVAKRRVSQLLAAALWLLFLPNAPYIITDFIHLDPRPPVPIWFDIALLTSFAATGLYFAFTSVADIQHVVARAYGVVHSWIVAISALLLSGLGIYLGRFLRWNSWDLLTNPSQLATDVVQRGIDPRAHPRSVAVTAIYGAGLVIGYIAMRAFAMVVSEPLIEKSNEQ